MGDSTFDIMVKLARGMGANGDLTGADDRVREKAPDFVRGDHDVVETVATQGR